MLINNVNILKMKNLKYLVVLIVVIISMMSCQKESLEETNELIAIEEVENKEMDLRADSRSSQTALSPRVSLSFNLTFDNTNNCYPYKKNNRLPAVFSITGINSQQISGAVTIWIEHEQWHPSLNRWVNTVRGSIGTINSDRLLVKNVAEPVNDKKRYRAKITWRQLFGGTSRQSYSSWVVVCPSGQQAEPSDITPVDEYLTGDWNGDGRCNVAIRKGNKILMDYNFDGVADFTQLYGAGNAEDEYLVGDWDGDGRDNIAVRRNNSILMDYNFDGSHDFLQGYGAGNSEDEYLVGDWDRDGRDNIAVRRNNSILMDYNFDGSHDFLQGYGAGNSEDEYLVGDWDGDGRDNIAVRRNNSILMDYNFDGSHDLLIKY